MATTARGRELGKTVADKLLDHRLTPATAVAIRLSREYSRGSRGAWMSEVEGVTVH